MWFSFLGVHARKASAEALSSKHEALSPLLEDAPAYLGCPYGVEVIGALDRRTNRSLGAEANSGSYMSFTRLERREPPDLAPSGDAFSHFAPHKSKE